MYKSNPLPFQRITSADLNCENVTKYIVYYCSAGLSNWLQNSTQDVSMTLTGLVPNVKYEVVVEVMNNEGLTKNGAKMDIMMPEGSKCFLAVAVRLVSLCTGFLACPW